MVIIYKKTLEKKGADDVTSKRTDLGRFQTQTMSQGTALFSCGLMESSRWGDGGHGCGIRRRPVGTSLESLWDGLPEARRSPAHRARDAGGASGAITALLRDLSLTEAAPSPSAAPPSKRQCRSLSCSDDPGGCRSAWRPQGSRVWTAVEKRRCHSGGSVGRGASQPGFPAMQRSSSFSLPARRDAPEPPGFAPRPPCPSAFAGLAPLPSPARPLYLSHEQICLPEPAGPSPPSSPDSTPELERRCGRGGLARSRSQPCVLNDKKIGVKRRRPADTHKQRPSLDLAKMTQTLGSFHSLSCPGIPAEDVGVSGPSVCRPRGGVRRDAGRSPPNRTEEGGAAPSEPDVDDRNDATPGTTDGKDGQPLWAGLCSMRKDAYQLGGELDIEQIERN